MDDTISDRVLKLLENTQRLLRVGTFPMTLTNAGAALSMIQSLDLIVSKLSGNEWEVVDRTTPKDDPGALGPEESQGATYDSSTN